MHCDNQHQDSDRFGLAQIQLLGFDNQCCIPIFGVLYLLAQNIICYNFADHYKKNYRVFNNIWLYIAVSVSKMQNNDWKGRTLEHSFGISLFINCLKYFTLKYNI